MKVHAILDRIEGGLAVLELAGRLVDWPVDQLPEGAREGSRLSLEIVLEPDARMEAAQERLDRLSSTSPKGDVLDL